MTLEELKHIIDGMRNINELTFSRQCEESLEQLHSTIIKILTFSSNLFNWNVLKYENYIEDRLNNCRRLCIDLVPVANNNPG